LALSQSMIATAQLFADVSMARRDTLKSDLDIHAHRLHFLNFWYEVLQKVLNAVFQCGG